MHSASESTFHISSQPPAELSTIHFFNIVRDQLQANNDNDSSKTKTTKTNSE